MRFSLLLSPLLFLCLFSLVVPCYAEADDDKTLDIMQVPERLSNALGIPLIASQLFVSGIFLVMFLLPCAIWSKDNVIPSLIVGFVVLGFLIVIDWIPYWIMLIVAMIVALMYAGKMRDFITGSGGE